MESQPSPESAPSGETPPRPDVPAGPPGCPDCGAPLGERPPARCPGCRLPLQGAVAAQLWRVEQGLQQLDLRRLALLEERAVLLGRLRALRYAPDPAPGPASVWAGPPTGAGGASEVSGRSAQTALLVLGGALVVVAALVFTVVSWGHLGLGGRTAVLLALTGCALAAPVPLRRKGLAATAETFATIGLVLVLLDCYATRAAGLAGLDAVGAPGYWAVVTALVAAGAMGYGATTRLRAPLAVGFLLGRLPALLGVRAAGLGDVIGNATALVATAAVDYAVLRGVSAREGLRDRLRLGRLLPAAGVVTVLSGLLGGLLAVNVSLAAGLHRTAVAADDGIPEAVRAWLPLGGLALLALAVARPYPGVGLPGLSAGNRLLAAGTAGAAVLAAAGGTFGHLLPAGWSAAGFAWPAALLAVAAGAVVRPRGRAASGEPAGEPAEVLSVGLFRVAGLTLLVSSVASVAQVVPALFVPLTHVDAVWASATVPVLPAWPVPAAGLTAYWLPVVVLAALHALNAEVLRAEGPAGKPAEQGSEGQDTGVQGADGQDAEGQDAEGQSPGRRRAVGRPAWPGPVLAVAGVPGLALLPVALGLPYGAAVATAAGLAVLAAAAAVLRPAGPTGRAATPGLVAATVLALLWALADRAATITVLALGAAVAGMLTVLSARSRSATPKALRPDVTAAFAVSALGAEAAAVGWTAGLALPDAMLAVLAVAVAAAAVAALTAARPARRAVSRAVEGAGYALAAVACALTAGDLGRLSFALTVAGVAALGIALRRDRRRPATVAAVVLLIAASWLRLALWEVRAPEAYSLSVSAAALVLGGLQRRRDREVRSWAAYGPGLALGLAPSLVAAWGDTHWLRPLLLGAAAVAVTVLGVRFRLQAPLLLGGATLLLVGGHELAPTVVQVLGLLPRWAPLAAAGLLLLVLGATYEQRLRDARRLRAGLGRLG
ncbi:hypothetical protein [Kitasatospora sp. NPDC047058]|uniref:SCO7613 C-terminal domain-containing membrane protein n=1 Tax=Kitasatospora sp. NPDC047058 TaxID=3155620 RepID=UPI0033EC6901